MDKWMFQWQVFVNTAMDARVTQKVENFVTR
jgi:hypothetical protein